MTYPIYKIKDSVDLFLSDEKYLMAYYMNTRQRKSFSVKATDFCPITDGIACP